MKNKYFLFVEKQVGPQTQIIMNINYNEKIYVMCEKFEKVLNFI